MISSRPPSRLKDVHTLQLRIDAFRVGSPYSDFLVGSPGVFSLRACLQPLKLGCLQPLFNLSPVAHSFFRVEGDEAISGDEAVGCDEAVYGGDKAHSAYRAGGGDSTLEYYLAWSFPSAAVVAPCPRRVGGSLPSPRWLPRWWLLALAAMVAPCPRRGGYGAV